MNAKISVLIPTYNRAEFLPRCLESLFAQTVPPHEIIVIDDGSTDGTAEVLRSFGDRIKYLHKPNGGKSSALNVGLEAVTGDYIWTLDDDNIAMPQALERMVAPLEADPDLGMTFSTYMKADAPSDGIPDPLQAERLELPSFEDCDLFYALLRYGCFIGGSAMLVRASLQRQVGLFNPKLIRSQDYDMALRVSRVCKAVRVDKPTFYYGQHEGLRGTANDRFTPEQNTSKWRTYNRMIIRQVRGDLPLEDYLPRSSRPAELSPAALRQAYLQRAGLMAWFSFFPEMLEDLRAAGNLDVRTPLNREERGIFSRVDYHMFLAEDEICDRRFTKRMKKTFESLAGHSFRLQWAQYLYWYSLLCRRNKKFGAALRVFRAMLVLLEAGDGLGLARMKLTGRKGLFPVSADAEAAGQGNR
jgi:glycosyltransferase involved in cell wall biosynthesis